MKKLIDLPDSVIITLSKEAKDNARSVKSQLEYILKSEAGALDIVNANIEKMNKKLKK